MKPLPQNFDVLTQCGDVIDPKLTRKMAQTKNQSKKNFDVRYSFMKLFSRNLEILAPCCDLIVSELRQKNSNLYILYNWL